MSDDKMFDDINESAKRALEGLLAEFGSTLPSGLVQRLLRIATPYISFTCINGICYNNNSYAYKMFETIVSHVEHEYSIGDIKQEIQWLINNIDKISEVQKIE